MELWLVVDYYEDMELLGMDMTREQAEAVIAQRIEDTDGECDCQMFSQSDEKEVYQYWLDRGYE